MLRYVVLLFLLTRISGMLRIMNDGVRSQSCIQILAVGDKLVAECERYLVRCSGQS